MFLNWFCLSSFSAFSHFFEELVFSVLNTGREKISSMPIEGNAEKHRGWSVPNHIAPELRAVKQQLCSTVSLMDLAFRNSHINVVTCFENQSLALNTIVESPTNILPDCQRQDKFFFQYESHSGKNERQMNSVNKLFLKQASDLVAYIAFIGIQLENQHPYGLNFLVQNAWRRYLMSLRPKTAPLKTSNRSCSAWAHAFVEPMRNWHTAPELEILFPPPLPYQVIC